MRPLALQFLVFRDGGSLRIVNQVCPSQRWVFLSSDGGGRGGQGQNKGKGGERDSPRLDLALCRFE